MRREELEYGGVDFAYVRLHALPILEQQRIDIQVLLLVLLAGSRTLRIGVQRGQTPKPLAQLPDKHFRRAALSQGMGRGFWGLDPRINSAAGGLPPGAVHLAALAWGGEVDFGFAACEHQDLVRRRMKAQGGKTKVSRRCQSCCTCVWWRNRCGFRTQSKSELS